MSRVMWQFVGTLLLLGFVGAYLGWIIAGLAIVALAWVTARAIYEKGCRDLEETKRRAEMIGRAEREHSLVMRGDPQGTYGLAWPQRQKYERALKRQKGPQ